MVDRSVSSLSTVKILELYGVPISRYEVPKVAKELPIFIYLGIRKV
jgi:hypothetical protein